MAAAEGLRGVMAAFPTGVAVVASTGAGGVPYGMTCSALCSVSLEPPTLLVCLRHGATLDAVLGRGTFAVNLLHDRARATAELFASAVPDRFEHVRWQDHPAGGPYLFDVTHAVVHCRVVSTTEVGDHAAVFGGVSAIHSQPHPTPLLYGLRRYSAWPAPEPCRGPS
ncbi:flavin reductase family protein [Saccharothrix xinjiangensis]|uniref:Flavin reductase family protein n=1 Tax=Saccharothrix xinjiangensis TaxID=204798 RepID=A0ABV9Y2M6_9PSEU